ncbi:ficolin-2-like isoform X1 [Anastrepha ludens]|uniref:ficolin-2-like isoform X1 n=1 Tax=Anastrepha ludens TaxID=28586 RepID=UPI0023B046BB|nr:ficolin-2-like isoform X1 [Anastrepha ludens]
MNRCSLLLCLSALLRVGVAVSTAASVCSCDADNMTDVYNFYANVVRKVQHDVDLLSAANSELRVRLEDLNERLNDQRDVMSELRAKINNTPSRVIYEKGQSDFPSTPEIDVRNIFKIPETEEGTVDTCSGGQRLPQSCAEATANSRKSGRYTIQDDLAGPTPFWASCDEELYGGAWTVIQRRVDGKIDFYRNWSEYKEGFGKIDGEFWIGLDRLYAMTTRNAQELLIIMEDFDNVRRHASYDEFAIGDESEAYVLKVLGNFSGDAGDSLTAHVANKWSTPDRDNDRDKDNCAQLYKGGWWFENCHLSNLNGLYLRGAYPQEKFAQGIVWHAFRGYNYALKFTQMMIRPRRK